MRRRGVAKLDLLADVVVLEMIEQRRPRRRAGVDLQAGVGAGTSATARTWPRASQNTLSVPRPGASTASDAVVNRSTKATASRPVASTSARGGSSPQATSRRRCR
jgi:hypothetical protein